MRNEFQSLPSAVARRLENEIRPDESVLLAEQPIARGLNKRTKILLLSALFVLVAYPLMLNTFVPELGLRGNGLSGCSTHSSRLAFRCVFRSWPHRCF